MIEVQSPEDIPDFPTEASEAEFWATHSFGTGFLDRMGPVPEGLLPPARPQTRAVTVTLEDDVVHRLKALAHTRGKSYRLLLREFVLQRLSEEESRRPQRS